MLAQRYVYDGVSHLPLTQVQLSAKKQIEEKISQGEYEFETIICTICGGNDFQQISTKDRYGLYYPVVICKKCGLCFTNPRMNQSSYDQFYNIEYRSLYSSSGDATDLFFKNQYKHGRKICRLVSRYLPSSRTLKGLIVLEVGCGAGGILKYFQEQGSCIYGVDLGEKYIDYGRTKHNLNLTAGTIKDLPNNIAPDLVIYSHVLEHVLDPTNELSQVRSILKDDGILYVEVPGINNLSAYELDFLRYLQNAHVFHFSLSSLTNLLSLNNFQLAWGNEKIKLYFARN